MATRRDAAILTGARLRALREWLEQDDDRSPCPPGVRAWLRVGLADFAERGVPIGQALGLDVPPGGSALRPAAALRLAERDLAIAAAMRALSGGVRTRAAKVRCAVEGIRAGRLEWVAALPRAEVSALYSLVRRFPDLPTSTARLHEIARRACD